ncbi:MAG: DMT family transporter [Candidatus Lokiarchaeota archaeon]|nr:DMT family transporter [Candidatus Lokiarchaeota archaeon]
MLFIYGLLVLMVFLWSFSFVLVDIAVDFIPPTSLALTRFLLASLSFLIVDLYLFIRRKQRGEVTSKTAEKRIYTKMEWIYLGIASFTGTSFFFAIQYAAIELIGPSLPALFVCLLAPVLITILALVFFNERLTKLKIIGYIIATIGGFLLVTGGDFRTLTPETPNFLGYLFALITPLLWAIYTIVTKKISKTRSNFTSLKYIAYFGTLELFIFVLFKDEFQIFTLNMVNPFVLISGIYLGIGCYVLGYFIWQKSQNELKSSKGASFLYIEPFLTLIFSIILNRSETILIWNIIGGIIVLVAVLVINYK